MQGEGIDCSHVICDATQRTGFQFKGRVTDGSDPPVEYHRKGSAASQMAPGRRRRGLAARGAPPARHRRVPGDLGHQPARPRAKPWT